MMAQSASLLVTTWRAILGEMVYIGNIAIGDHTGADLVVICFSIASQGSTRKTGVYWACNKLTSGSILGGALVGNEQLTMEKMGKTPASIN